jgi:hypothetical protein
MGEGDSLLYNVLSVSRPSVGATKACKEKRLVVQPPAAICRLKAFLAAVAPHFGAIGSYK